MLSAESPLLSPSNTQNSPWVQDWEKSFKIHGFPLPPPVGVAVVSSSTAQPFADSKAPPISAISRKLPGLPYLNSNAKYLYQLGLAAVNELPLPSPLFTNGKSPQRAVLSPRLSLFDLASGVFFGSTWTGNSLTLINLREAQGRLGTVKSASPFLLGRDNETEADSNESEPDEERQPIGTPATNQFSHLDRVSVDFRNMVFYLQTPVKSQSVIAVIEFIVSVQYQDGTQDEASAGWTFFHPFHPSHGGLDPVQVWKEDEHENEPEIDDAAKIVPIFSGTPRALVLVGPLLQGSLMGFPGLSTVTGASLNYRFIARPDARNACHLWNENCWVAPGDRVPGLKLLNARDIIPKETSNATISNLRLRIAPSIEDYEKRLLEKVALTHFEAFPASMISDETDSLILPVIEERRIRIGFHNGYSFIGPSVLTNAVPELDDRGHGSDLVFHGQLELPKYLPREAGVVLVFVVEYKVRITVRAPAEKKNALSALVDTITKAPKPAVEKAYVEKLVSLGWSAWSVCDEFAQQTLQVQIQHAVSANPFSSLLYAPSIENVEGAQGATSPAVKVQEKHQLSVLFRFHDDSYPPVSSMPGSPVLAAFKRPELIDEATSPLYTSQADIDTSALVKKKIVKPEIVDEDNDDQIIQAKNVLREEASQFPSPMGYWGTAPLSRVEKARLLNAGFNILLDEDGHRPVTLSPSAKGTRIELGLEKKDLRFNDIHFNFMGLTFNAELFEHFGGFFPASVFFTFQFYNFPQCTSERLHIYTGPLPANKRQTSEAHHRSTSAASSGKHARQWSQMSYRSSRKVFLPEETTEEEHLWPGILYSYEEDGIPNYGKAPGLEMSYLNDPNQEPPSASGNPRFGPDAFAHYMSQNQVYVDVWDGDSLLHLGVCSVPIKAALRLGRSAIQVDEDVDIIWTEFPDDSNQGLPRSSSVASQMSTASGVTGSRKSKLINVGKLHVRMTNIGRSADKVSTQLSYAKDNQKLSLKEEVVIHDYHGAIKHRVDKTITPHRMPEVDLELKNLLKESYEERAIRKGFGLQDAINTTDKIKKLEHTQKLLGKQSNSASQTDDSVAVSGMYNLTRDERQRDLQTMDVFRERKKKSVVQAALREQITTKHLIVASFGQAVFFEFELTNPYNAEHNFEIEWDDSELRLIKDWAEWKYLRKLHKVKGGVENRLIAQRSDGTAEVYLLPNETLSIPFVFQSFCSGLVTEHASTESEAASYPESHERGMLSRTIQVNFLNGTKSPIAILEAQVSPRYYFVDRTLRFFRSENDQLRKAIKVPQSNSIKGPEGTLIFDTANPGRKYLRCSHPDVVCSLSDSGTNSNSFELKFKHRTDAAPGTRSIYFMLYYDAYCTILAEVWRVTVHSLQRLDVTCLVGQSNNAALIVKGGGMSRSAQCYSNQPQELLVSSFGPFLLTGNSLNEIGLYIKPKTAGTRDVILNIVDTESRSLLSSWLVVCHANAPQITKSFDIGCKRGKLCNKRVSYTNPYAQRKVLYLKTDSEHLLNFKEPILDLDPGATKYIGLQFLPVTALAVADILIFLNDDQDQIEECLSIKVRYE